jgi:hypothetical protein
LFFLDGKLYYHSAFSDQEGAGQVAGAFLEFLTVIYRHMVLVLLPLQFLTVNLTVYFPALLYLCTGFFWVEYVPSPKLHFLEIGDPVLLSVNRTFNGAFPEVGDATKAATSFEETRFTFM